MRTGAPTATTIFRSTAPLAAVLLLLLSAFAGCGGNGKDPEVNETDLSGYYEARSGGVLYVVGSLKSADAVRAGNPPKNRTPMMSPKGQRVEFEDNGRGLAMRLMNEYDRRYGMRNR